MAIAAVLLTLIVGAGAAIATHDSSGDRAQSAPAGVSYSLPGPEDATVR